MRADRDSDVLRPCVRGEDVGASEDKLCCFTAKTLGARQHLLALWLCVSLSRRHCFVVCLFVLLPYEIKKTANYSEAEQLFGKCFVCVF